MGRFQIFLTFIIFYWNYSICVNKVVIVSEKSLIILCISYPFLSFPFVEHFKWNKTILLQKSCEIHDWMCFCCYCRCSYSPKFPHDCICYCWWWKSLLDFTQHLQCESSKIVPYEMQRKKRERNRPISDLIQSLSFHVLFVHFS